MNNKCQFLTIICSNEKGATGNTRVKAFQFSISEDKKHFLKFTLTRQRHVGLMHVYSCDRFLGDPVKSGIPGNELKSILSDDINVQRNSLAFFRCLIHSYQSPGSLSKSSWSTAVLFRGYKIVLSNSGTSKLTAAIIYESMYRYI